MFVGDYPQGSVDSNPWNIFNWMAQGTATGTFNISASGDSTTVSLP